MASTIILRTPVTSIPIIPKTSSFNRSRARPNELKPPPSKKATIPLLRLSLPTHRRQHLHHVPYTLKSTLPSPPHVRHVPYTLKSTLPSPPHVRHSYRSPKPNTTTMCSYTPIPAADRLISAASYLIPFFTGLQYDRSFFAMIPFLDAALKPLLPIASLYHNIPFAGFVTFFALYLGVIRNPKFSRFVKFNVMQALFLDFMLTVPMAVLQKIIGGVGVPDGIGLDLLSGACSVTSMCMFLCFVYGLLSNVFGKTPYFPFVEEAVAYNLR